MSVSFYTKTSRTHISLAVFGYGDGMNQNLMRVFDAKNFSKHDGNARNETLKYIDIVSHVKADLLLAFFLQHVSKIS